MSDLPARLRAYNPHDATARALMDEAATHLERLRAALQRYVDSDDCEYADGQPATCPGDPPYVSICHWHQGRAALAALKESV